MCGFFGVKALPETQGFEGTLNLNKAINATNAIRHRGPDDEGFFLSHTYNKSFISLSGKDTPPSMNLPRVEGVQYNNEDLLFGFRRLSIIDLSIKGHQPMYDTERKACLVFNGEIYNYRELKTCLEEEGVKFNSDSDTEVVLQSYLQWGTECFKKFVGMWAIAIWDYRCGGLILSRDPFGIKPLFYCISHKGILFGSELKGIQEYDRIKKASAEATYNFLTKGRTGLSNASIYENVFQVPTASFVLIGRDSIRVTDIGCKFKDSVLFKYWDLDASETQDISFQDAAETLREKFQQSIKLHTRSDVPLAVNLSGGVDSSAVLMAARAELGSDTDIRTFSFIADENFLSEEKWVDLVVKRSGAKSYKFTPTVNNLWRDLKTFLVAQDEPVGSLSPYAQFCLFKTVGNAGIKVTLDGQGADEYLAGYNSYLSILFAELVDKGAFMQLYKFAEAASAKLPGGYKRLLILAIRQNLRIQKNLHNDRILPHSKLLSMDYFNDNEVVKNGPHRPASNKNLIERLKADIEHSSLPELLRFADRNSMAHSVESRVPFLTTDLVSFCLSLPSEYLINEKAETKSVFKEAMKGVLPDEIIERKDKIGFTVPEKDWMLSNPEPIEELLDFSLHNLPVNELELKKLWLLIKNEDTPYNPVLWRSIILGVWATENDISFT